MKRLLLVMDTTESARPSLDLSLDLARGLRASLSVLRITDPVLKETEGYISHEHKAEVAAITQVRGDRQLSEVVRLALEAKVTCRPLIGSGDVIAAIMAEADEADLLIIGRRGPGIDLAYGMDESIVESFLRQATIPVVLAGTTFRSVRNILVAFDGQASSVKALTGVVDLILGWRGDPLIPRVVCVGEEEETAPMAEQAYQIAAGNHIDIGVFKENGKPEEVITNMVVEKDIDLLAMGIYSRTGLRQKLFGSVTEGVLSKLDCSLLVCH
ncbi:MAG: universal stress protein [bacterium]